jgi:VIT1/CCC1 family predicted Fe2+/Mn2+ transporter
MAKKPVQDQEVDARLSANQVFTMSCTSGFIPAALVVLVVYMITRSWQTVAITAIGMLIALLAFSNLMSYFAHRKALKRSNPDERQSI